MTPNERAWAHSRDRLAAAVGTIGLPGEMADLLAKQLKSPTKIDRMTEYIYRAHPDSMEMLVDEMQVICAETDAPHKGKESEKGQVGYNAWLNNERSRRKKKDKGD